MERYRLEILGSNKKDTLNLEGCISIEKYTPDRIDIKLRQGTLTVKGRMLSMPVYVGENLCIAGHIKAIELEGEK